MGLMHPAYRYLAGAKSVAIFAALSLALGMASPGAYAGGFPSVLESELEAMTPQAPRPHVQAQRDDEDIRAMQAFYEDRNYAPLWLHRDFVNREARLLLDQLREADSEGLDPHAYAVERIAALIEAEPQTPAALVQLEVLLTGELLRYARDLRQGRMSPAAVYSDSALDQPPFAARSVLRDAADATNFRVFLRQLTPGNAMYHRLRRALIEYRVIAEAGGWPTPPESSILLGYGTHDPAVAQLREYLWATGDLSIRQNESHVFDTGLALALERYQRRHGLAADGVYGQATRRQMATPVEERIRQIQLNMERWRWMPDEMGDRHVLVNLAGFEVEVVEHGSTALRMRAVVGRPYRKTPVFSDKISYLEFNPTWTVPPGIMRNDLIPNVRANPDYLEENNFHLYSGWEEDDERLDPHEVDWDSLDLDRIPYRFVQQPGPENALGRVKFMFPNKHYVYLHDTPEQRLFGETERAFSSGCIRVEKPMELAEYLLGDRPDWDRDKIDSTLDDGELTRVRLPKRIPVHLTYSTAWVGEGGTVHFRSDIYERDSRLEQALGNAEMLHRAAVWN